MDDALKLWADLQAIDRNAPDARDRCKQALLDNGVSWEELLNLLMRGASAIIEEEQEEQAAYDAACHEAQEDVLPKQRQELAAGAATRSSSSCSPSSSCSSSSSRSSRSEKPQPASDGWHLPAAEEWHPSAERDGRPGYWFKFDDDIILGVRQCRVTPGRPVSWTANISGRLIRGDDGKPVFYPSGAAARRGAFREASWASQDP